MPRDETTEAGFYRSCVQLVQLLFRTANSLYAEDLPTARRSSTSREETGNKIGDEANDKRKEQCDRKLQHSPPVASRETCQHWS